MNALVIYRSLLSERDKMSLVIRNGMQLRRCCGCSLKKPWKPEKRALLMKS